MIPMQISFYGGISQEKLAEIQQLRIPAESGHDSDRKVPQR